MMITHWSFTIVVWLVTCFIFFFINSSDKLICLCTCRCVNMYIDTNVFPIILFRSIQKDDEQKQTLIECRMNSFFFFILKHEQTTHNTSVKANVSVFRYTLSKLDDTNSAASLVTKFTIGWLIKTTHSRTFILKEYLKMHARFLIVSSDQ